MSRKLGNLLAAIGLMGIPIVSAHASPNCLSDQTPFALSGDTVVWTMHAAPGSECIQGLRWSYMQIYSVSVSKAPTKGKLAIVGPGFRYIANSENDEADNFTLVVMGKNRRDIGSSIIEIVANGPLGAMVSELRPRP